MVPSGSRRLQISRRRLLIGSAAFGGTALGTGVPSGLAAPGVITSDRERPQIPYGVMSGDPTGGRAIIWSKTDRPARMLLEFATREDFRGAQRVAGPAALAASDYTARVDLGPLPPGARVFYRVSFQGFADLRTVSAPASGVLRMPGGDKRTITFAYSGDEAGQGWAGASIPNGAAIGCMRRCGVIRPISSSSIRQLGGCTEWPNRGIGLLWEQT
jgi:alkaline phosphatase D